MTDQERESDRRAGMRLELCRMLDLHGVANGDKAIARFVAGCWSPELLRRYGPAAAPRTIREWRKNRGRRDKREYADMLDLRYAWARRVRDERRSPPHRATTEEE